MSEAVHIIAVGARTPVGLTAESSAAASRARISRIREHAFMVDLRGELIRLAQDESIDRRLTARVRMLTLASAALQQVVRKVEAAPMGKLRGQFPIFLGLTEDRLGFADVSSAKLEKALAREASFGAEGWKLQTFRQGHASVIDAMRHAERGFSSGEFSICVVGGVDSYADANTLLWLDGNGRLAAEGVRAGFPPGEGAAFLALATESARVALAMPSLGMIRGLGTSVEPHPRDSDEASLGQGLTAAIIAASSTLLAGELIDDVYCDINGERHRSEEWGFALLRSQQLMRNITYTTPVGEWGDVGAATGALLIILALQAWQRGYSRGKLSLIWSSSDHGLRSAAVLERPSR
jgi:3-oxoacyl-[acyl-carrier-protein] synthase-1